MSAPRACSRSHVPLQLAPPRALATQANTLLLCVKIQNQATAKQGRCMGHQNGHQNGIFGVQSQTALQNLVPRAFPWKRWERGWALKWVVRNDHAKEYICLLLID